MIYVPAIRPGREYNKFKLPYTGPHTITRELGAVNFEVTSDETGKKQVVHFDKLRKLPANLRPPLNQVESPPETRSRKNSESDDDSEEGSGYQGYSYSSPATDTEPVTVPDMVDAPADVPEVNDDEEVTQQQYREPTAQPLYVTNRTTRRTGLRPRSTLRPPSRHNDISSVSQITQLEPYY